MLWSNLERTDALARLRNTLHHLQRDFIAVGLDPLQIDDRAISFRAGVTWIDVDFGTPESTHGLERDDEPGFLIELDGIDPAFDRWLTHLREQRRHKMAISAASDEPVHARASRERFGHGPSLVVTEFDAAGPDVEDHFAMAVTEEVGSALAKLRWFTTITRSMQGQRLAARSEGIADIADYLLVGTLQRDDAHYRLSIKLLDLNNAGVIVWVTSLAEPATSRFAAQHDFAIKVAARLDTELLYLEADRRRRLLPRAKNDAYTLVMLAVLAIYRLERDPFIGAGHALEQAVAMDRESAWAHSWLAYWHMFLIGQGWAANPFQSMAQAGRAANRAMMLDPKDARAVTIAGHVKAFLGRRLEEAATLHELAIQINPALPLAWHLYGITHAYAGRLGEAYAAVSRCRELAPDDPHGFYAEGALGIIHLLRGDHDSAIAIGRRVTERHPQFSSAYKSYLAALGHLGRKAEAADVLERLLKLEPRFSLQRFRAMAQYQRTQDLEHFITGLRLAGLT
jgi:TolB-like protein/Flp pilus assembly protein TadD